MVNAIVLRFVSGRYRGGEFPLRKGQSVRVGRDTSSELVLLDDLVSWAHARFTWQNDGTILLEDLGSTNGTYVNSRKVDRAELAAGDRVLLGSSLFSVVADVDDFRSDEAVRQDFLARGRRTGAQGRFSGDIQEIPLTDVLQLLSTGQKSGVLRIEGTEAVGCIRLREGQIVRAEIDDVPQLSGREALFRLLGWNAGTFELVSVDAQNARPDQFHERTEALLLDVLVALDEAKLTGKSDM